MLSIFNPLAPVTGRDGLTKKDIIKIADTEYDWSVANSSVVIFDVVDEDELFRKCNSQLGDVKNKPLVYIVDLGSSYWVTLVIVYCDQRYFAFYIDPLREKEGNNVKAYLEKKNIHCPNIEVKQTDAIQTDANTAIFALQNAEEILKHRKIFSKGINIALKKIEPPNNDIDQNVQYKRVAYSDLDEQLEPWATRLPEALLLEPELNGEETFIICPDITRWAILTVGKRDEQNVACYVANNISYSSYIRKLLSDKGIIPIYTNDTSTLSTKFNNDIELFILQTAKVVTNYFKNRDYVTHAKVLLETVVRVDPKEVIKRLKARYKIEDKIVCCKSEIDKYIERNRTKIKPIGVFTTAQSNLLILFLESIALEDKEISLLGKKRVVRIRELIMNPEEFEVINLIRSEYLLHRSVRNINTVIKCTDIIKFIRSGVNRIDFFQELQIYLTQIVDKLNRREIGNAQEIRVSSLFQPEDAIRRITFPKVETEEYLSNSFRKLVKTDSYSSKDRQMIMFELNVNVNPLIENTKEVRKLPIKEYNFIRKQIKEILHKFHKFTSEADRKLELKKFLDKVRSTFFKYVFSHEIFKLKGSSLQLSKGYTLQFSEIEIEQMSSKLKEVSSDFNYVAHELGDQNNALNIHSIASKLESSENSLGNFISNYVKLMLFIDNEDEVQKRKEKHPSLPQRYDQPTDYYDRLSDMRLYVYDNFNILKQLYSNGRSHESNYIYKKIKEQLAKELRNKCGILKPSFESIVDLYVEGTNNRNQAWATRLPEERSRADWWGVTVAEVGHWATGLLRTLARALLPDVNGDLFTKKIYDDICTVSKIKGNGKDLEISDIIEFYSKRESLQAEKGSTEEKFKSIPKGEIVNINGINVNTDRFVVNILKLFNSFASQYRNVFNNVEEAFNDETFLSFLKWFGAE